MEGWNLEGDFIDLFAWQSQFTTIIMLIECSRVEKSNPIQYNKLLQVSQMVSSDPIYKWDKEQCYTYA